MRVILEERASPSNRFTFTFVITDPDKQKRIRLQVFYVVSPLSIGDLYLTFKIDFRIKGVPFIIS